MAVQAIPGEGRVLVEWHPEDETFWGSRGKSIAQRNLWVSIPALLLAFTVWMVWPSDHKDDSLRNLSGSLS